MKSLGKASIFWSLEESLTVLNYHRNHKEPFSDPVMTRVSLTHICMLEHLSLNLFFILVGYLIDFHVFFRRWVHKLDKKCMDSIFKKIKFKESFRKRATRMSSKHRKWMVPGSCQSNHWLETSTDDHTSFCNLPCFQWEISGACSIKMS